MSLVPVGVFLQDAWIAPLGGFLDASLVHEAPLASLCHFLVRTHVCTVLAQHDRKFSLQVRHTYDIKNHLLNREMVIWGYTPRIFCHLGVRAKCPRGRRSHVPQPAPNPILTRWQGARRPCLARPPFLFFFQARCWG